MAKESQLTADQKRDILLKQMQGMQPEVEKPKPPQATIFSQLKPVRQEVRTQVQTGLNAQSEAARKAAAIYVQTTGALLGVSPRVEDNMKAEDSQLLRFYKTTQGDPEGIFKNCKVQYAYNQRQKIYSVSAMLDGRPRIITMRVGENFTDVSLADQKGNLLEVLRQEDRKGVTFSKMG